MSHQRKRVRTTSAAAYREITPTLSRREQIVLDAVRSHRGNPPTAYELTEWLKTRFGFIHDPNGVRPRLTSLQGKRIVVTGEKRKCRVTGKSAFTWLVVAVPAAAPTQIDLWDAPR